MIEFLNKDEIYLIDVNELLFINNSSYNLQDLNFSIYKLNIFDLAKESNLSITQIFEINKQNFKIVSNLDDGDIISISRGFYSHHVIVTGKKRFDIYNYF